MKIPSITFEVSNMNCASCVGRVEKLLQGVEGISSATVNLAMETATVSGELSTSSIRNTLEAANYPARVDTQTFLVKGMSCASCVGRVESALMQLDGVISASVNIASESAQVSIFKGSVTNSQITAAIESAGYHASAHSSEMTSVSDRRFEEARFLKRQVLLALVLTLPVVILAMGSGHISFLQELASTDSGRRISWTIQLALTSLLLILPGRSLMTSGFKALSRLAPDMNSLVAIGVSAAFIYSLFVYAFTHWVPDISQHVYFESAAVIITLILLGRYFESRAKGQTGKAVQKLLGLKAQSALVDIDGVVQEVAIADIVKGQHIHVRPGENIAADGIVVKGASYVNESMLTGEAIPVEKNVDSHVVGGSINGN